jgi:peptidoglycan glycosyltransferase
MRQTITGGSGLSTFGSNFPIDVAGKTGTAQFGNEGKTHAWFTSFAPYDNPEIAICVFVEGGGEGYKVAAPVAKTLYEWYVANAGQ